ncbi:response regulator transcription factor [Streptomyces sp. ODS28]|uniref:response regulator transcription factor n=1 Tax=Streptomyces sp. ODS28 TaxID=3136688 RepID=UPI0031E4EB19
MIQVLLVHDVGLLRCGLAALINGAPDMASTAIPWHEALHHPGTPSADVYVVDADTATTSTPHSLAALHHGTGGRILALAGQDRPGALRRALDARALGLIATSAGPELLLTAIREVAAGRQFVDQSLAVTLLHADEAPLTQRELAVLRAAAQGASIPEIAQHLSLAQGTVRNYISAVTRKTGARNRVDAIRIAQGTGWL